MINILSKLSRDFKMIDDNTAGNTYGEIKISKSGGHALAYVCNQALVELKWLMKAALSRDVRYYLNSVLITNDCMVATDGHRLHKVNSSLLHVNEPIMLPRDTIKLMFKFWKKGSLVKFDIVDRSFVAIIDDVRIESKLIDGKYPDYERVIPKKTLHTIDIDGKQLKAAHKHVNLINKANRVKTGDTDSMLSVLFENDTASYKDAILDITITSSNTSPMLYNMQYLNDAIDSKQISAKTDSSSLLIEYDNRQAVVMHTRP